MASSSSYAVYTLVFFELTAYALLIPILPILTTEVSKQRKNNSKMENHWKKEMTDIIMT